MTDSLRDRARTAAVEVELERTANAAAGWERCAEAATGQAVDMVEAWCATHGVHTPWTLGPPGSMAAPRTWRVPVTFEDDLELLLELELGDDETGGWWIARRCPTCGDEYATPAGWVLADLGRALEADRPHGCGPEPDPVVVRMTRLTTDAVATMHGRPNPAQYLAASIAELEGKGYIVDLEVGGEFAVVVARRGHPWSDLDEPF